MSKQQPNKTKMAPKILILNLLFNVVTVIVCEKIAIDPTREQLIIDALNWMTFRKNGQLVTSQELESLLLPSLIEKYTTSKFYRTFVIAFQHGVLPRLTLNENDRCDPAYTSEYKHPFNNSVTWHYQKKFTFKSYDDVTSGSSGRQYCDYRQGLICNPTKKTCQCPDGTKMEPIDPAASPQVKRCLFQEDEICSLIDIEHHYSIWHLTSNLYHMIFNLEKPPSCKAGTQCQFKPTAVDFPRCYSSGPFGGVDILKFGEECTLGLIAEAGSCGVSEWGYLGFLPGFTCYNFGPPNSIKSSNPHAEVRTGFCALDLGPYGLVSRLSRDRSTLEQKFDSFLTAYVHPGRVPLRGKELYSYWEKLKTLYIRFDHGQYISGEKGRKCSVSKTKKMEDVWQYFMDLKNIPAGQDYATGATKALLDANLQEATDLMNTKGGVCKVWNSKLNWPEENLKCVADSSPDADGNDGKCEAPGNLNTIPDFNEFKTFLQQFNEANIEQIKEESIYRKEILLTYPDPPCLPSLGGPLPSQQLSSRSNPDTLEGGYCPADAVCYMDFSDAHGHYDSECNLISTKQLLVCHDNMVQNLGDCEKKFMGGKVKDAMEDLGQYGKRDKGEQCYYAFEKTLREKDETALAATSPYLIMNWIERDVLCDMTGKNLECTSNGICEIIVPKTSVNPVTGGDRGEGTESATGAAHLNSGISEVLLVVVLLINITY